MLVRCRERTSALSGIVRGCLNPSSKLGIDLAQSSESTGRKDYETFRKMLGDSAENVEHQVNKLIMGWKEMRNEVESQGILDAFMKPLELLATCTCLLGANQDLCCMVAREQLVSAVVGVYSAILNMFDILIQTEGIDKVQYNKVCGPAAGMVWEACKRIIALPKTNRMSVKRNLLQSMVVMKDTHAEFSKVLSKAKEEDDGDQSDAENSMQAEVEYPVGSDEWYDMMDRLQEDESMDEEDVERLENMLAFIQDCVEMFCKSAGVVGSVAPFQKGASNEEQHLKLQREYTKWLNGVTDLGNNIKQEIDALGMLLYPPHDEDQIQAKMVVIRERLDKFTQHIISRHNNQGDLGSSDDELLALMNRVNNLKL
mmetsp:Transcript_8895/g.14458  ORF Transcript_8895/g.14458 Transcript_8895/m.14458 type:complete len:370 (+) Transcript_8895:225-1334(+)